MERNAIIGDDAAARKRDIPIVQLNPGGVLNYKYDAECALRASGLPYTVIRCTGEGGSEARDAAAARCMHLDTVGFNSLVHQMNGAECAMSSARA